MKLKLASLLVAVVWVMAAASVSAHATAIAAKISFQAAGGGSVAAELRDPYDNLVPTGKLLAGVGPSGSEPKAWTELKEGPEGIYTGIIAGSAAQGMLHLKAEWPDGDRWAARLAYQGSVRDQVVQMEGTAPPAAQTPPPRAALPRWAWAVAAGGLLLILWGAGKLLREKVGG